MTMLITLIFVLGYVGIAFEHPLKINKTATALLIGVLTWTIFILVSSDKHHVNNELSEHLSEISQIVFFLMGAMTIVELIDGHNGFSIITEKITATKKTSLLWIIGLLTFFLSSVLDNLTTTIVIVSLLRKLIRKPKDRLFFAGIVVVAANAGGAWTPIGDVTTTMLWIGNQISAGNIMLKLLLPSLACLIVPLAFLSFRMKGNVERPTGTRDQHKLALPAKQQRIVFYAGVGSLIMVPIFKTFTHLPPYMGILLGVSIMWIITELLHRNKSSEDRLPFTVPFALRRIDLSSILFFLGILICIASLESAGILPRLALWMNENIRSESIIAMAIGILSSIVDNVPLVAACQGMYPLSTYPTDSFFWEFLAFTAGTGGSILIIGSAAGVAAMGLDKIDFIWYMKNISLLALLGFLSGSTIYILQHQLIHL
jgi:Na+/H+ antiporter NhaD/arsenite permease-like protein